jgi:hypothetical protein
LGQLNRIDALDEQDEDYDSESNSEEESKIGLFR